MTSVVRLSRYGKIAAISALCGSAYVFRNDLKQYIIKSEQSAKSSVDLVEENRRPQVIDDLPERVPYLLVGGGSASHSAMRAIRGHDPKAKVLIITSEDHSPYMRPALSKELWYTEKDLRRNFSFKWWNGKERSIFYEIDEFFIPLDKLHERETGGVSIIKKARLERLDPDLKTAYLESGQSLKYDKCLLAPGGTPKTLPSFRNVPSEIKERIVYFRTADDFLKLEKITETAKSIVIVGGGFLGSELACALSRRPSEKEVPEDQVIYQIYPETGNLAKVLPAHLSEYVSQKVKQEGAKVIPNVDIGSVELTEDNAIKLSLSNGESIVTDYIVCAVGLEPDVDLAKASSLEVDEKTGGYLVNSELEARTDVWVAGDASCFYDVKLGRRRVEHHDHAIHSGRQAGQNMVGANLSKVYSHQSMFWSDLGPEISFEAVGIIDSTLPTVSVFVKPGQEPEASTDVEPETGGPKAKHKSQGAENNLSQPSSSNPTDNYSKGLVFYLKDDVIVGILLWNTFNRLNLARRIINEQRKYDDYNEVAKLFNIYSDE